MGTLPFGTGAVGVAGVVFVTGRSIAAIAVKT